MPKRSNEFQRLIATIVELLGDGATVTESKMLRELDSDAMREVDVCIEGVLAGQPVTIGIECRDHKRKQTVEWVETMIGRHASLPTDQLVLVSSSGFTPLALDRARKENVKAITTSRATPELAHEIVGGLRFRLTATIAQVTSSRISLGWPEDWEGEQLLPSDPDLPLYGPDLTPLVTIGELCNYVMVRHLGEHRAAGDGGLGIPPDAEFTVSVDHPRYRDQELHVCVVREDAPVDDPNPGRRLPLRGLTVTAKWSAAGNASTEFTESGVYGAVNYWAGKSQAGPALSEVVAVERPSGAMAASVSLGIVAPSASGPGVAR